MGGRVSAEGHRPILIPTPEIFQGSAAMLATIITSALALLSLGLGAWLVLAGVAILMMLGRASVLFCLAVAVIGLALFMIGAIGTGRIMLA